MQRIFFFLLSLLVLPAHLFASTDFVSLDGVNHTVSNGVHTLQAKEQVPVLIEKKNLPVNFEKISFKNLHYSGTVFFIWQPVGGKFDPNSYNFAATMDDGTMYLPNKIERSSVEIVGVIFPVGTVSFSDITLGNVSFSEKFSRLFRSHTPVLPSTVNLLYPKYFGATPLSKALGVSVLLLGFFFLFYKKHTLIIICLTGWFLWDIFYALDQKEIMKTTYQNFVVPNDTEKQYFDLGNQYGFAKSVTKYGKEDVGYFAPRIWPFYLTFLYHTYPTLTLWQGSGSSLIAVYSVPWSLSGTTLTVEGMTLSGEYSVLEKYSDTSYLFSRK